MQNSRWVQRAIRSEQVRWRKSLHSNPNGNCVELATLPTGHIAVRNSRSPAGPVLICTRDEVAVFVAAARDGDFDELRTSSALPPRSRAVTRRNRHGAHDRR